MIVPLPCPVCGFLVNTRGFYGSYEFCPICQWEDDGVQLANPCSGGGANRPSLAEAQAEWLDRLPLGIRKHAGHDRSERWRPLTADEIKRYQLERRASRWSNRAVVEDAEAYWGGTA